MKSDRRRARWILVLAIAAGPIFAGARDAVAQPARTPGAVPPSAQTTAPLTLEECVDMALRNSASLAISRAQLAASEGSRMSSWNAFLPSASLQSAYVHTTSQFDTPRINEAGEVVSGSTRATSKYYTARTGVTESLIAPSGWYRFWGAGSDVLASRQGLRATRAETIYQVRQGYFLLVRAILLERVSAEALQVSDEQLSRSQALFDVGSVARSDVLQASVNRASAERVEISARNAIEQQRALLAALMGLDLEKPLEVQTDVGETPPSDDDESALVREALEIRPEVRQARAQTESARLRYRSAFWSLWPYLDGSLFWQRQENTFGKIRNLSELDRNAQWGFQIGLNWNVFDGLSSAGRVKSAAAGVEQARQAERLEQLNTAVGIREALVAIKNAREELAAAEHGVSLAEENLRLQQALYKNGGGTIIELNTAQSALTKARSDQVDARISLHLALAQLDRAVGSEK